MKLLTWAVGTLLGAVAGDECLSEAQSAVAGGHFRVSEDFKAFGLQALLQVVE